MSLLGEEQNGKMSLLGEEQNGKMSLLGEEHQTPTLMNCWRSSTSIR